MLCTFKFTCGVENRGKSAHNSEEMVVIDEGLTKGLVHRVDVSHCLRNDYINHLFKTRMETSHNQSIRHNCEFGMVERVITKKTAVPVKFFYV